jgi:hypothetical protein
MENGIKKEHDRNRGSNLGLFLLFIVAVGIFAAIIGSEQATTTAPNPLTQPGTITTDTTTTPITTQPTDTTDTSTDIQQTIPSDTAQAPAGATAQCTDGTYSYDSDPTTACAGNGGVAQSL